MLHAIQPVPRTPFTAASGLNTEEFVDYPTIIETACGRYGDMISGGWDMITGVNLTTDELLPDDSDSQPLRLVKTVESHRLTNSEVEIVERLSHTVNRTVVPIRVKYLSASRSASGTHRRARSYVYHGNLPVIFDDLVPAAYTTQDFCDIRTIDPKMVFVESVQHFARRPELAELAEEVSDAVQTFHRQNPLMQHITPNLYCTGELAMTMAPYLDAMMSQTHARMDRATQDQVWSPSHIQNWVGQAFSYDVQIYDPLTGRAISGGYHPRYLLGHLHGGQTAYDTTMPPAIQFDVDVIDTAPPELRAVAQAIDMFPVTDYVVEIDVLSSSGTPVRWLGHGDRYLGVWPLTVADVRREGIWLAEILRQTIAAARHRTVQPSYVRLTKTFADEALLEFFNESRQLLWGAYFDFARLSLGSVGVVSDSPW